MISGWGNHGAEVVGLDEVERDYSTAESERRDFPVMRMRIPLCTRRSAMAEAAAEL